MAGVESVPVVGIDTDKATVYGACGRIVIDGDYTTASVYTLLDGRQCAGPRSGRRPLHRGSRRQGHQSPRPLTPHQRQIQPQEFRPGFLLLSQARWKLASPQKHASPKLITRTKFA